MKILRLYTRLPPLLGGMENHIAELTREQIKLGHEVSIYFNQGSVVSASDIQITKINLDKIKPHFVGMLVFHFLVFLRVLVKKDKFDLLHIHGDWSSIFFSKLIKKSICADKIAITIHDEISDKLHKKKALAFCLRFVDIIFTTGYKTANQLAKLTEKKIIVQPSGVNEIFFSSLSKSLKSKNFTVITVANLFPKKNLELVLEIAKSLKEYSFIIIGEGNHRVTLEKIIFKEKIFNVELVGFKSPESIKNYLCEGDCYLLTSLAEGTPTSILEAMACGLPIVCSEAGGVESILDNKNFIIKKYKKNEYITSLSLLANNKKLRKSISDQNKLVSNDFKWKNVAKNIEKYL